MLNATTEFVNTGSERELLQQKALLQRSEGMDDMDDRS